MKTGLQVASFRWPAGDAAIAPAFADVARSAEEQGFDSFWVMDHFFGHPALGGIDSPMLEGYSALSFVAGLTTRMTLGTLVTGIHYRAPGLLAKTVTTLDVLSGGRAWLGVGAGSQERESSGLGFGFPARRDRYGMLEETLQAIRQMWTGDRTPYVGTYIRLDEPVNVPQPLSKPHPPIMVGGMGERLTLRAVARYADACNFTSGLGAVELRRKLDILKQHCDDAQRPYEEIERTVLITGYDRKTPKELIDTSRELASIGFQHVMFGFTAEGEHLERLRMMGREVIPSVREMRAS